MKGQAIPDPPVSVDLAESHGRLYNPGSISAKPLITVTATGAFSLIVGAVLITDGGISYYGDPDGTHTFTMANTTGETVSEATVVIDADAEIVTSADGTTNLTVFSTGPFPTIDPGFCNIAWSGNISSLTITPRWRWI